MVTNICTRSSDATTHARVDLGGDFKRCCMKSGRLDGSVRDHYFQGVDLQPNTRVQWTRFSCHEICIRKSAASFPGH